MFREFHEKVFVVKNLSHKGLLYAPAPKVAVPENHHLFRLWDDSGDAGALC